MSPRNEISPRQAAEYHVFGIKLTFIAASCVDLKTGEIKNKLLIPLFEFSFLDG
jgi:hypothetical protein